MEPSKPATFRKATPRTHAFLWFAWTGFLVGLVCAGLATLYPLLVTLQPLSLRNLILAQTSYPMLWYIDVLALVMTAIAGMAGWQVDRLNRKLRQAETALQDVHQDAAAQIARLEKERLAIEQASQEKSGEVQQLQSELADLETESQQTEKAISRAKKQWEASFDSIRDLILLSNSNGTILRCNRAAAEALQLDYKNIIGKQISDFVRGEPGNRLGQIQEVRLPNLERWYEVSSSPLDIGGDWPGNVYILRDVSERKQAALGLQVQKQYYESLVRNLPAAIVTLRMDHTIVECNPAFEKLFGYMASEATGRDLDDLVTSPDTVAEAHEYTETVERGAPVHIFGHRRRKDGSPLELEIFGIPLTNRGRQIGILVLYQPARREKPITGGGGGAPPQEQATPVIEIPGIDPGFAQKLSLAGVYTNRDLLKAGASRTGRAALAEQTGLPGEKILEWVNRADLMRVPGLGEEFHDLLGQAGVDTLAALCQCDPQRLHASLEEINRAQYTGRRPPPVALLRAWIEAARGVPPIVTH